jgi:sugar phosphate isomerase/epimerase
MQILRERNISVVSGMFGTVGEDYSTLDTIRVTGGIAPDQHWPTNLQIIEATASLAKRLGLNFVTFHAGFIPHDPADPAYTKMLNRQRQAVQVFADSGLVLGLETGQEAASDLAAVMKLLNHPALAVNFDPANMILYGKGNPIEAIRVLGPWIRQVHIKDAVPTGVRGTWGEEVPAGSGGVDWPAFFATLKAINFSGDFVIEREAGNQRVTDICTAKRVVEQAAS